MNKSFVYWFLACVLIAGMGVFVYSCGGGGGGGNSSGNIQLSGAVSTGYTVAKTGFQAVYAKVLSILGLGSPAYAGAGDLNVNKVLAIPMDRGSLTAWGMQNSVVGTINPGDGTFSLSLSKSTDWLLVLIDSQATGTDKFVGSVAMNTATSDSLLNLPATDAAITRLDLGSVTKTSTSSDAISSATVTAVDFNMSAADLTAMAKSDDLFRNAMNIVNNYGNSGFGNAATDWYQLRPDFHWLGSYATLTTTSSDPNAMVYNGMNFQLDTNTTNVLMSAVCTTAGTVALHPPVSAGIVTMGTKTYDYTHPIQNSGSGCTDWNGGPAQETSGSDLYACNGYEGKISYSVLASFMSGSIPTGFWEWKENGTTKAAFEIGNINPPITPAGQLKGFMPSYKVNVDVTNKILSVDISWYYLDGASYQPLTDLKLLKHFIESTGVKFDVGMGVSRKTCEMSFDPTTTTHLVPSSFAGTNCNLNWYLGNPSYPDTDTGLMGFYESGGFGYFFDFFKPMQPPQGI